MANSFDFIEIKYNELVENINTFIKELYNKSDYNLSEASPYGQILTSLTKLHESSLLYLKNVVSKFDINNPYNKNTKVIRTLARIGGYNPSRNISATGTIALQLKPSIEINEIPGGQITIFNKTHIRNSTNNLNYFFDLGGLEYASFKLEKGKKIILPLVQGSYTKNTSFTGNGKQLQSYTVVLPSGQTIEQYRILVKVNGTVFKRVEHLFDMLPDEKTYMVMTGIEGEIDIYFGTNDFGYIPKLADKIEVEYVISDGANGNIPNKLVNDFVLIDDIYDAYGSTVDIENNFNIFIENEISLGSDAESVEFTKAVMPYASRNFVLARPEQYIYMLKRLNAFSQIDAFTTEKGTELDNNDISDDSVVYLFLIPNIELYLTGENSYFDLDMNAFYLDDFEKNKIEKYLKTQGIIYVGTTIKILDPVIRKYVINISLRIFEDAYEDNIRLQILNNLSNFFKTLDRRGRIDKSAIIKIIEEIDGVDSVMVDFISEANETYHKEFIDYKESILRQNSNINIDSIKMDGYEPNRVIGLDNKLGDIIYNKDEIPIIRGGWKTRDNIEFKEYPQNNNLGSVNIEILGYSKKKLF